MTRPHPRLRSRLIPAIALGALVLSSSSAGRAATPSSAAPDYAGPHPASVTTVGTLRVERYGSGSPAMVFIPGLSCGSWVWSDAVKHYAGSHAVYVVTLAGFDGLPAPATPTIDAADASLLALLTDQKIDRPIVVGHSLGGFLALRFGTEHSALVRGIVSVDGLPILPQLAQSTASERDAAAKAIATQISSATPEQYAAQQKKTLATMITAPADVDRDAALSAKSDPGAVAAYMSDLLRADLRPQLAQLTAPTLEIAPVPTTPASYEPPQAATASMTDREAGYKAFYTSLFPGTPHLTVVPIPNSLHFVMVDQPAALFAAIDAFVATLPS